MRDTLKLPFCKTYHIHLLTDFLIRFEIISTILEPRDRDILSAPDKKA